MVLLADYNQLSAANNALIGAFLLSGRDTQLLLTALENYRYRTRYFNNEDYSQDDVDGHLDRLILRLSENMDCQAIADCISNPESPANTAVSALIADSVPTGTGSSNEPSAMMDNVTMMDSCSEANIFAACVQIVDFMDSTNLDLLEELAATANSFQTASLISSAIPAWGQIVPLDETLAFIADQLENILANYSAESTVELRNDLACGLFCIARTRCENGIEPSIDFLAFANYFLSKVGESLTNNDFLTNVQWLLNGTFSGDTVVYAMFGLQTLAYAYLSSYANVSAKFFSQLMLAMQNDINEDYDELCDTCAECVYFQVFDFRVSPYCWRVGRDLGFVPSGGYEVVSGVGRWVSGGNHELTDLRLDSATPMTVTKVAFSVTRLSGSSDYESGAWLRDATTHDYTLVLSSSGTWTGSIGNVDSIQIAIYNAIDGQFIIQDVETDGYF